jgi:alkaline phosphatase
MPILSPRARLLALLSLLALAGGLLAYAITRPDLPPEPALDLPSVLPSIGARSQPPSDASGSPQPEPEVLLAVADIGSCDGGADDAVAVLASRLPGTIALMGDLAYEDGSHQQFARCFDPAWGPMRERLRPVLGNHELRTEGADGYFDYFGAAAGEPGRGWYSYDLGAWHVVALNSNCEFVSCSSGSAQVSWLRQDLADHPSDCLLAYWHHPRWSSGKHGSQPQVEQFWQVVADAGADVILNGHDHTYERVLHDGVRQFIVGTGGRSLYPFEKPALPETEVRWADGYGLLWLALDADGYAWEYLALGRSGFTDSGSGDCS